MRKLWICLLLGIVALVAFAPSAFALEQRTGTRIVIAKGETIADDTVLTGTTIIIDGTIQGDVIALANTVQVNGTIDGNLITAATQIDITGHVTGSVVTAGEQLNVDGRVDRNLVSLASTARLDQKGTVGRHWIAAGDEISHAGDIGRGLIVAASRLRVEGKVGQDLTGFVDRLTIDGPAVIKGTVTYTSDNEATIAPLSTVGQVTRHLPTRAIPRIRPWYQSPWTTGIKFGGFIVVGLVVLTLFPRIRTAFPKLLVQKPWQTPGVGLLVLVAVPLASIILLLTLIGLPLGLLSLLIYPLAIYVGQICVSWTAGKLIADRVEAVKRLGWPIHFLIGALTTTIAVELPIIGGIVAAFLVLFGLGGLFFSLTHKSEIA